MSTTSKVAPALVKDAMPHLVKWWKAYSYQRGLQTQHLSPFEVDVAGSLFKNAFAKIRFRIQDNFWTWGPPVIGMYGTVQYVQHLRHEYLMEHRD